MSLKNRLLLTLAVVVALYAVVAHAAQVLFVSRSFEELEAVEARKDVQRVVDGFEREMDHLATMCRDWGFWDDTYRFALDRYPEYIEVNLQSEVWETSRLSLIYVVDLEGRVVWGGRENEQVALSQLPVDRWPSDHPLLVGKNPEAALSSLLLTEDGPMLVAAGPILDSARKPPSRGTLLLGRRVDDEFLQRVRQQANVVFRATPTQNASSENERTALAALAAGEPTHWDEEENQLTGYALIADASGAGGLLIQATIPREIMARGRNAAWAALAATLAGALIVLVVLYYLLQKGVVGPLTVLTRTAVRVGETDDLSVPLALERQDEIGILSREFETMTKKLAESRAQLVEASRKAGQSDVASNVLHNVGNMLNSVILSADLLREYAEKSSVHVLPRVTGVLREHRADLGTFLQDDPRGKKLPDALEALSGQLEAEAQRSLAELGNLDQGLEDIARLVKEQQRFASSTDVLEVFDLRALIDQAVRNSKLGRPGKVAIQVDIDGSKPASIRAYRHKLLQIFLNVLNNAQEALVSGSARNGVVHIRVEELAACKARVEIEDSGPGVPPEARARLFNHGFTTKQEGHGFGLHASANDAKIMGGSLRLADPESGRGALFVLEFPFEEVAGQPAKVAA